jgi:hypothetical protein
MRGVWSEVDAVTTNEEATRSEARRRRNEKVPFDWRIVKVEQKAMCAEEWVKENHIATCGVFYLYDANRHVHICSFEPTYELHAICGYATSTLSLRRDLTDEESNALNEVELEMLTSEEHDVSYMDVPEINRMPQQKMAWAPEREPGEDCETYYLRAVEEFREELQGNPPWF